MAKQHAGHAANTPTPAEQLVGRELPNDWMVEELIERSENATGGHFLQFLYHSL